MASLTTPSLTTPTPTLTTHVLDTALGRPAAGIPIRLYRLAPKLRLTEPRLIAEAVTNADGRTDRPLLAAVAPGTYELRFLVAAYLAAAHPAGGCLDEVPVRIRIDDATRGWHVPLLLAPWAYSTYRGS